MIEVAAAAAAGVGASILTWLSARRAASGRVETSDATALWQEAREQRDWLAKQLETVRVQERECQRILAEHEATIIELRARIEVLEAQIRGKGR